MRKKRSEPVPCENINLGCPMVLTPKELKEHKRMCLYQISTCEGCGEQMKAKDLLLHQKVKKCLEQAIQRERIQFTKDMHRKSVNHNQRMRTLKLGVEQSKRQRVKLLVHEKIGWSPQVPNAWGEDFEQSMIASSSQHYCPTHSTRHVSTPRETDTCLEYGVNDGSETENTRVINNTNRANVRGSRGSASSKGVRFKDRLVSPELNEEEINEFNSQLQVLNNEETQDLQVVPMNTQDEISTIACSSCDVGLHSQSSAIQAPGLCIRCGKFFRFKSNRPDSCKYHKGPIVNVHGGMCTECGMLDFQPGCCEGPHIPLDV